MKMHEAPVNFNEWISPGSIKFAEASPVDEFCANHISGYQNNRYEAIALSVSYGSMIDIVVYAIDKEYLGKGEYSNGKLPVKQFSLNNLYIKNLLPYIDEMHFCVQTGRYKIEEITLINLK